MAVAITERVRREGRGAFIPCRSELRGVCRKLQVASYARNLLAITQAVCLDLSHNETFAEQGWPKYSLNWTSMIE